MEVCAQEWFALLKVALFGKPEWVLCQILNWTLPVNVYHTKRRWSPRFIFRLTRHP